MEQVLGTALWRTAQAAVWPQAVSPPLASPLDAVSHPQAVQVPQAYTPGEGAMQGDWQQLLVVLGPLYHQGTMLEWNTLPVSWGQTILEWNALPAGACAAPPALMALPLVGQRAAMEQIVLPADGNQSHLAPLHDDRQLAGGAGGATPVTQPGSRGCCAHLLMLEMRPHHPSHLLGLCVASLWLEQRHPRPPGGAAEHCESLLSVAEIPRDLAAAAH